jgi:hypothetical protein
MSVWANVPNPALSNQNQQVACRGHQAQQPVSCCMARKILKYVIVIKISRSPAGVTKPNSLCHAEWPEKL